MINLAQTSLLLIYAFGLATGQLLFKLSAARFGQSKSNSLFEKGVSLVLDPIFILAMVTYFGLSLFWVWLLSQVPISKAYPFVAVNFIIVAVLGVLFFSERMSMVNWGGLLLIAVGVVLAVR